MQAGLSHQAATAMQKRQRTPLIFQAPQTSHADSLPACPTPPQVKQHYPTAASHLSCHLLRDLLQLPHFVEDHMLFSTFTSGREFFQ